MRTRDARTLPSAVQESLRLRAVRAVQDGLTQQGAGDRFGVSRGAICGWLRRWREGGAEALKAGRRGRPPLTPLTSRQTKATVRLIVGRCPDQLRLPFALWTREAVRRWLREEYPAIRRRAKQEGAEIHWGDEMGLRSDHQAGRSYGLKGQTPVILRTGQRFGCSMVSTITNPGRLTFMVFRGTFTVRTQLKFLRRLLRQVPGKMFWIVDRHPVHRAAAVPRWLEAQRDQIERFYLPAYSPELNADELLNEHVKTNAVGRRRASTPQDLIANVRGYLRSTQRQPHIVCSYFREKNVRYAAA